MANITGEEIFDSIKIIADAEISKIKFDETIICTIVDASEAKTGKYIVSNSSAKFNAYSEVTDYPKGTMVMVTIPQGDYNNQKMIIGKYVSDNNTPFVYKSPFQQVVDLTSNIIRNNLSTFSFWANGADYIWDKEEADYNFTGEATNPIWQSGNINYSNFTRLGIRGEFSTWLGDYDVTSGDYGLALKIKFNNPENNEKFYKWVHFNSSEFFGDIYNFETFYSQEIVFDITQFLDFPIVGMELYIYQRDNFYTSTGEKIAAANTGGQDFSDISPNIFIKDLYVCLGVDAATFGDDTLNIAVDGSATYHRNGSATETAADRDIANTKHFNAQWVHKDEQTKDIKIIDNYEFPKGYKIQWFKSAIGAQTESEFLGAHWKKLSDRDLEHPEGDSIFPEGAGTNGESNQIFQIDFIPNAQKQSEIIIALIIKEVGPDSNILIAKSKAIELLNDDDVPHNPTMENINALGIEYDDPFGFRGNFLLYNRAGKLGKEEWGNTAFTLKAVFGEKLNESKSDIPDVSEWSSSAAGQKWESIEWIFPVDASMIICLDSNKVERNGQYHITNKTQVNYGIKKNLNRAAINNTVQLIVVKDTITYTATVQMLFGTAGTSGSDYTMIVDWSNNALIPGQSLSGDVGLVDQSGTIIDGISGTYTYSWYKIGTTDSLTKTIKTTEIYCPVLRSNNYSVVNYTNGTDNKLKYYILETSPSLTGAWVYNITTENGKFVPKLQAATTTDAQLYKKAAKGDFYFKEVDLKASQWNTNKRYFVCYDNIYLLDPWDSYQEGEIYYEPVSAAEYEYGSNILTITHSGLNESHFTINAPSNLARGSLYILQITLEGFGDYDLIDRYPIAVKKNDNVRFIEGPTYVRYASTGEIDYEKNPYKITKQVGNDLVRQGYDDTTVFGHWSLLKYNSTENFDPELKETYPDNLDNITTNNKPLYVTPKLAPVTLYIPGDLIYGVQFFDNNLGWLWTQPVLVYEDNYPSTTLNQWDGKNIKTDNDTGTIVANGLAAGKKESDNTFTGVVLGDWSRTDTDKFITRNTGIYGFNHGSMSYALKDDGTGFIGKDGRGRIYFNGNSSQIYSSNWRGGQQLGMFLDIDDGVLKMNKTGAYITLSTQESTYPLSIGSNSSPYYRNFKVEWDGTLHANGGVFSGTVYADSGSFTGSIYAGEGNIGGWEIGTEELYKNTVHLNSRTGTITGATLQGGIAKVGTYRCVNGDACFVISDNLINTGTAQFDFFSSPTQYRESLLQIYCNFIDGRRVNFNSLNNTFAATYLDMNNQFVLSIEAPELRCLTPATKQYGIYARFA